MAKKIIYGEKTIEVRKTKPELITTPFTVYVYATFGGEELYPTVEEKAARLGFALASNHPFVDGNKRIGVLCLLTFLAVNCRKICATNKEIYDLGMALGKGEMPYVLLLDWVKSHSAE